MHKVLGVLTAAALIFGVATVAAADPPSSPPGQGECEHGNSGQECREDPQPDHGQDCDEHGNSSGNEDHCASPSPSPTSSPSPDASPSPSPSPEPSSSPTPSPTPRQTPTPVVCDPSVTFGPWYGDPRINIRLEGPGNFAVKGGIQRFTGKRVVRVSLACDETFKVSRYKVRFGHEVRVYLNGELFASRTAPRVR